MKYIWGALIVAGLAMGIINGQADIITTTITSSAKDAALFAISMIGTYCLWLGLLNIARESGFVELIAKAVAKPVSALFKQVKRGSEAAGFITLNFVANMLGMGNAATPFGLSAMAQLQKENPHPDTPTTDMCTFLIVNISALQILPLTIIAVRTAAGATNPADIIPTAFLATFLTSLTGVILAKIFAWRARF